VSPRRPEASDRHEAGTYRATRCRSCQTVSKGWPEPSLSPSVVIAYCTGCKRKMPSDDLGLATPASSPVREEPALDTPEAIDDASGMGELEPDDEVQRAYRDWRATSDGQTVVDAIRRRARELRQRGWTRYGIQAIAEVVRFDHALSVGPDEAGYKVNNSHLSRLARDLMREEPSLAGFFETRELRA
jgi:hypothetical protein